MGKVLKWLFFSSKTHFLFHSPFLFPEKDSRKTENQEIVLFLIVLAVAVILGSALLLWVFLPPNKQESSMPSLPSPCKGNKGKEVTANFGIWQWQEWSEWKFDGIKVKTREINGEVLRKLLESYPGKEWKKQWYNCFKRVNKNNSNTLKSELPLSILDFIFMSLIARKWRQHDGH